MRNSPGTLISSQIGVLVAVAAIAGLSDAWPDPLFWVIYIGLFLAIDAGLMLRYWADRRARR